MSAPLTPAEVLEQAAQLIEQGGWCRYRETRGQRHCVRGAFYAVSGRPVRASALTAALWAEAKARGSFSVSDWNDQRCRNGKEAAAFLRAAKARL